MSAPLRALVIEDSDDDARLLLMELDQGGYDVAHQRVETPGDLEAALAEEWDVIFADYSMPRFTGLQALKMARAMAPDLPFLFVSGTIGESRAVEAMKAGADDYFVKGDLHRLVPAVGRELRDATARRERRRIEAERSAAQEALELSEERHRLLFQHIADAILVFDREGTIRFASASALEVLGRDPEALRGRPSLEGVHPDDIDDAREAFRRATERPNSVESIEVRMRHVDGSWRPMDCVLRNLLHQEGIEGVVVTCRDVAERKRLEAEIRQAQKLESIGRLAGGIAHDFNNLLTAILGHADFLLEESELQPGQRADLEGILGAGERATRLTRQLLAFSRRQVLDLRIVDMNQVVEELAPMLTRLLGEPIHIETTLEADPGTVRADVGQLEQVIVNLAVNARDAMPEGGRLAISTSVEQVTELPAGRPRSEDTTPLPSGSWVRLSVADTGSGMDGATRARLFDPFFTTKPEGEGTGLGLATVYGIVKQSGGEIHVESAPDKGSRFDIYLPHQSGLAGPRPDTATHTAPRGGTETVLVVEDEDIVRDLVTRALRGYGYNVIEASSGEQAKEVLGEHHQSIGLLLTDAVLPGVNGREIAESARELRPDLPVLYMSGYAASTLGKRGVLDAGEVLLDKPFTATALVRKVREVLDAGPSQTTS
jgi:hypothetical protein